MPSSYSSWCVVVITALVFILSGNPGKAEFRTWTDVEGRTVEAEMLGNNDTTVKMRLRNGVITEFPLAKLSAADRKFVIGDPIVGNWGSDKVTYEFHKNGRVLIITTMQTLYQNWERLEDGKVRVTLDFDGMADIFTEKIEGNLLTLTLVKREKVGPIGKMVYALEKGHPGPRRPDPAQADTWSAQLHMNKMMTQLRKYEELTGSLPTTKQGLMALAVKPTEAPIPDKWQKLLFNHSDIDPWGNKYEYSCPQKDGPHDFDIWTNGPDGKPGTKDDISCWDT